MMELADKLKKSGFVNRKLRDHQDEGVKWLCECLENQNGCILADEMGLGKTTQSLAFIALNKSSVYPSLILAPLSVINNWVSECQEFLPSFIICKYYGDAETRQRQQNVKCDIMLTTYEMFLKDVSYFTSKLWNILIVDEGHRLKNSNSQSFINLQIIQTNFRVILSGTPVQNNIKELYTLLSFVDKQTFAIEDLDDFCERYTNSRYNTELHDLLRPFLLRRTKNQVLSKLPPAQESIIYCHLTKLQRKIYKGCLVKDASVIDLEANKSVLQNTLMQLRKCSNHPYMFNGVEPEPFCIGEHLVEASGKLNNLDIILKYCQVNQHKVLIFSQFTLTLDILQDYAHYRKFTYERLDGSVRDQERYNSISNFSKNDIFLFFLSTKAGGVGLNLTAADTVIFFDSDWNPQNDIQAAARAHRIGQTKPVKIIRLVSKNSVDEYMLNKMESKLKLTNRIIVKGEFSSRQASVDDGKTLSDMLVFGLSDILDDCDDVKFDETQLGKTNDAGEWVFDNQTNGQIQTAEINDNNDFYDFEGTNYRMKVKTDKDALKKLVEESQVSSNVVNSSDDPLSTSRKRKAGSMTLDELQEKENMLEEQRLAAAQKRRAAREAKKKEKWDEVGYISTALPPFSLPPASFSSLGIDYVVGDVTAPDKTGVIIHCIDSSGEWGRGGLFTAISRRSDQPSLCYELAKDMDDVRLGQCHLVPYKPDLSVALLICVKRGPSSMKLDFKSFEDALTALTGHVTTNGVDVHMPRVGFTTSDWYGTERLLRKCLLSQDVKTLVYYFLRGGSNTVAVSSTPAVVSSTSSSNQTSSSSNQTSQSKLSNSISDKIVYLDQSLSKSEKSVLDRYVVAFGGNIQDFLDENVTHVLTYNRDFDCGQYWNVVLLNPYKLSELLK